MRQADAIRAFVVAKILAPARERGDSQVVIRAGDVHRAMGLQGAMPAVCSALGGNKFAGTAGLMPLGRHGPGNGSNAYFYFALAAAPGPGAPDAASGTPETRSSRSAELLAACDLRDALVLISCVKSKRTSVVSPRSVHLATVHDGA